MACSLSIWLKGVAKKNTLFVMLVGCAKRFKASISLISTDLLCFTNCSDFKIRRFSCQQNNATRQQTHKLVTLPLAYAYRVNQSSLYTWACPYDQIHGPARVHQTCSRRCKGRSHSTWYSSTSFQSAGGHRYYKPHDDAWSLGERRDNYITLKHMNKRHWKLTINTPDRLKGARKLYWWT